ncbi:structural maintenance of chromosomes protein 2 [[Candida] anglica]|uniref:Structural maintenance of chromosomes protein n=1 Tax=[Candida] anglica TaxID=148631 RepID=A0ABP0E7U0_9ASCO
MKVEELILDGFKSYATRTVISGWDPQFNAITGLNGSGKSNILDAICFVLGIASMATVRASNLQDLIYKRGQAGVTKASVTIVFDNSEVSKSPIGFENFPKISVTRQIILGGSSKYLINGHKAQQQTVLNLFQSVQLNINNPNFLIMQGKITKVLNMKPSEILSLIEEAAGTRTFEDRKEKAQRTMAKKEAKLVEIRNLLQEEIEPKLDKLRNEKRTFLEFQQTQTDLEKLSRVIAAHDYVLYSKKFDEHSSKLNEREAIMTDLNTKVDRLNIEIENLSTDLERVKKQRESELTKDGKLKELELSENKLTDEFVRLNASKDITKDNLKDETKRLKKLDQQIGQLEVSLSNNVDVYNSYEKQYTSAKDELSKLKDVHSQKEELLSTLSTGVSAKGNTDGGYVAQMKEVKQRLTESSVLIEKHRMNITHLQQQLKSDKPKLAQAQADNKQVLASMENYTKELKSKEQRLASFGFDPQAVAQLRIREKELQQRIYQSNGDLDRLGREIGNIDFNYTAPYANFDKRSVKGVAAQLFSLDESQHDKSLALQVCAGGRLYNVIVDTSETASQLLERGKLRKRVTIIPLDKISSRVMNERAVQLAKELRPGKVDLALNLIGYEHELTKAMEYIFGNTLICQDPETAKTVTFNPQIRAKSVTVEGDIYDPEGNLSGGSRKTSSSILITIQKYNTLQGKIQQMQQELEDVRSNLKKTDDVSEKTRSLQNDINLCKHELSLLQRKLESSTAAEILRKSEENTQEIERLNQEISETEVNVKRFNQEIESIERDMNEFSSDKGSKLKKLEKEVQQLYSQLSKKEEDINEKFDKYQSAQMESEQQQTELKSIQEERSNVLNNIEELQRESELMNVKLEKISEELELVKAQLEDEKATLLGLSEEINELTSILHSKTSNLNENKLSIQKLNHEIEKSSSISHNLKKHVDELIENHEWILDTNVLENIIQQYPNINLEECHEQVAILEERFQGMRRKVNTNIMNMIDNVEKKESSLKQMIRTIEKDKSKIENTVEKLNGYKRSTLEVTYKKVSVDFGNIFADLLPGSFAKLVPVDMEDVTKGLEVKVKLGPVWKESLVELSGGQRSLIALSLIMALLQFKPAPMYILDEVDAALDLSHTQNIGHLIKTRFKGSQFIVVSLKEGMFTNANRVFRTRFQDGTSVVSVM